MAAVEEVGYCIGAVADSLEVLELSLQWRGYDLPRAGSGVDDMMQEEAEREAAVVQGRLD